MIDRLQARTRPVRRYAPLALWLGLMVFYLGSLGPTVLWGDHAYFQRAAYEGLLRPDGGGHWLWLQVVRLFAGLPVGTIAYRANLLSAAAALTTLALLYVAIRALDLGRASASIACLSLAVSHTFWMHSVRAEVYTVFTAVMALELLLWFRWRPESSWPAHLTAALFGLAFLAHQMATRLMPAALFLLWQRRHWFGKRDWFVHVGCFLVGLVPFFAVVSWQVPAGNLLISLRLYFTHAGADFSAAILDLSLSLLPRNLVMWV